jgi:2-haloacid dehalogenase
MTIRHVLFDVNGTLFDPSSLEEPLGREHRGFANQLLLDTVLLAMADCLSGGYRDFSELLEVAAARRLELLGRRDALDAVTGGAKEMRPAPDAARALELLDDAGIGAGALSNSSARSVEALAKRAGLSLSPIVGTEHSRTFKPHSDVYAAGVSAVGASPGEVVLITAHSWDGIGAKRAGLRVAWISRTEQLQLELDHGFDFTAGGLADAAGQIVDRDPPR